MEFYEKNIGTTDEGEPIIRIITPDEHDKILAAIAIPEERVTTYSCGVCGKQTTDSNALDHFHRNSPRNIAEGYGVDNTDDLHFKGCARIGMPTYW